MRPWSRDPDDSIFMIEKRYIDATHYMNHYTVYGEIDISVLIKVFAQNNFVTNAKFGIENASDDEVP